ncbi:hypothetical protein M440DRAFT_1266445 [Trichoderma longibrachiatum ATCC 18648]|uniref:Uncharacterized protein n=1 Tax=Trichoderma longibrachiatum ATCC 18648 TaxID=983965 RepID=A0A2T4C077_TRILO|nr:hypothetical protein M440DRAFT_1266445 [Trichoderma longibrachiatum ATCC 18648]
MSFACAWTRNGTSRRPIPHLFASMWTRQDHAKFAISRERGTMQFVYDRSLQAERPWITERNAIVEAIEAWCNDAIGLQTETTVTSPRTPQMH